MSTDIAASIDATYAVPQAGEPRTIAALDTPLSRVEPAAILLDAAARTFSPSDRIGDSHAAWLVTHPDAAVSTDLDYPNWTPGGVR